MADNLTPNFNDALQVNVGLPNIDGEQAAQMVQTIGAVLTQPQQEEQPQQQVEQQVEQEPEVMLPLEQATVEEEDKRPERGSKEWLDIAASPLRGILAAGQSAYELMDTVTADVLPEIDIRFLGKRETQAGQIIENISQFATGFAIGGAVGGWALKGLGGVVAGAKGAQAVAGALANPIIGGTVKGAITDFTFMDAHQDRLANLIQSVPGLQNPIAEYLSSDKDEGDIEGRLKNALEGAGLGIAIDVAVHGIGAGVKALKKGIKLKSGGLKPQEVADAMEKEMAKAEKSAPKLEVAAEIPMESRSDLPEGYLAIKEKSLNDHIS